MTEPTLLVRFHHGKDAMTTPASALRPRGYASPASLALPGACLLWAYWSTLVELSRAWKGNDHSHGILVPFFAAILLWYRRDKLDLNALRPSLWGLAMLTAGLALKLVAAYSYFVSLDAYSLLPCVAGLVLLAGGWAAWRWAWPAVCFLVFMMPLPYFVSVAMSGQLQWLATICTTYVMQTIGLPALAEGNVIQLNEHPINIVEACSGLRMLVVFVALSTAVVLVTQRHWVDRAIILFSAIPIALISNMLRIIATGIMYDYGHSELANHFFHDIAGWLMPPLALSMLWVELKLLDALFLDAPAPSRIPLGRRGVPHAALPRTRRPAKAPRDTTKREQPRVVEQPQEQPH